MTVEAFLEWEEGQPTRHEFDGFQPRAMTGGSAGHSRVQRNLIFELTSRLKGKPCEPFGSELKILAAGSVRYPDAFVVCSPVRDKATLVTDPVVVFEIISPSTSGVDRIIKNQEYWDTPSIQRYVILSRTGKRRPYSAGITGTGRVIYWLVTLHWRCRRSAFPSRWRTCMPVWN